MDSSTLFDEFLRKFEESEARWEERLSKYREWRAATVESQFVIPKQTYAVKCDTVVVADNWGGLFVDATDEPIPAFDYFTDASDSIPVERAFKPKEQLAVVAYVAADNGGGHFNYVPDELDSTSSDRDALDSATADSVVAPEEYPLQIQQLGPHPASSSWAAAVAVDAPSNADLLLTWRSPNSVLDRGPLALSALSAPHPP